MRFGVTYDVADLAVVEAVYVLQSNYDWTREGIVESLSSILELSWFNYNKALFDQAFPLYLNNPSLSFNDCCLSVYAGLNEAEPLWTFDKDLAKKSMTAKLLE